MGLIIVGIIVGIIGVFCGMVLALSTAGLGFWIFALGGEIAALFILGDFSSCCIADSVATKVKSFIGIVFWGIALKLLFSEFLGTVSFTWQFIWFIVFFIAPYFIVASLDAAFADSIVAMIFIGIAKVASSILLYVGKLTSLDDNVRTYNEISGKLIASFAIVSFLSLLSFIMAFLKTAVHAISERKKQIINNRRDRELVDAVNRGDKQITQELIAKGANINSNVMNIAVKNGNKEIVSLLIENGADIHCCEPLITAVENGDKEMVLFLIEKGADVNLVNDEKTPLDFAEDDEIISILKEHGAKTKSEINMIEREIRQKQENLDKRLALAIMSHSIKACEALVSQGADVNASYPCFEFDFKIKYFYEITPLVIAAINEDIEIIKFLVDKGARIDEKVGIIEGQPITVLKWTKWNKQTTIAEFLESRTTMNI